MLLKQPLTQFYAEQAKKVLNSHIKGYVPNLDHMCVTVSYRPQESKVVSLHNDDDNRRLLMLSPIDKIEDHYYNKSGYAEYDQGLSSKHYTNFTMYPWSDGTFGSKKYLIDRYKEEVYGLHAGHFLSVPLSNSFYLVFGIASHCKDPRMTSIFTKNMFKIIEAGLAYYSYLRPIMANHVSYELPNPSSSHFLKRYNNSDDSYETDASSGIILPKVSRISTIFKDCNGNDLIN